MRNDARDDDFENVPTLKAVVRDDDEFAPADHPRVAARRAVRKPLTGPLWALVCASFIALAGLGWWSFQQISLMEQQLVATQEAFARISEEAAGRLQAISGKVDASESNVNTGSEALKLQVKQLQAAFDAQVNQLNANVAEQSKQREGQAGALGSRLDQALAQVTAQQAANAQLQEQLKALGSEVAALKAAQADTSKVDGQIKGLSADIAALKKQGNPAAAVERLEQDLIVLKSEVENRPAAAAGGGGASTAEFDAFRGQMSRTINTLQSQVQNLQQQINARP
ncbi:ATPase [Pseudomonas fontis]|uniref:ATPase n=1 Tax=Pseudomonas fontis TaxID=2942633 RepID=A0ABT5NPG6_9PSED|nr:ATPase [Pseudomonas fontis]MDD0974487.1 ATPase [Pseudomonas fontis]MDD0990029.1 ATPase [Pseudomonas fontis]